MEDTVGDVVHTIVALHVWHLGLVPTLRDTGGDVESISGHGEEILSLADSIGDVVLEGASVGGLLSGSCTVVTPGHLPSTVVCASSVVVVQDGIHVVCSGLERCLTGAGNV
jgi:hypothetical protein